MDVDMILLYGGAALAVLSLLTFLLLLLRYRVACRKLDKQLDEEYGAPIGH